MILEGYDDYDGGGGCDDDGDYDYVDDDDDDYDDDDDGGGDGGDAGDMVMLAAGEAHQLQSMAEHSDVSHDLLPHIANSSERELLLRGRWPTRFGSRHMLTMLMPC